MHTILVMGGGLVLLGAFLLVGRLLGRGATAARWFIPVWLGGAGVNMAIGVLTAGYSVAEELPIFGLIFAVPALVAAFFWWKWSQSRA